MKPQLSLHPPPPARAPVMRVFQRRQTNRMERGVGDRFVKELALVITGAGKLGIFRAG